jgi:hypothetical protein
MRHPVQRRGPRTSGGIDVTRRRSTEGCTPTGVKERPMKITVETVVRAKLNKVWDLWNNPSDIKQWNTEFIERAGGVVVKETFDAETENTPELQRTGWQAILDNFGRHVEAKG